MSDRLSVAVAIGRFSIAAQVSPQLCCSLGRLVRKAAQGQEIKPISYLICGQLIRIPNGGHEEEIVLNGR